MHRFARTLDRVCLRAPQGILTSRAARGAALLFLMATACKSDGGTTGPGPAAKITFSASAFTFTTIGASQAITATVADANGKSLASAPVTWTSDNSAIAEVQGSAQSATIVAHARGTTLIHATSGTATATVNIAVLGVQAIVVTPANSTVRLGATQTYTAQVTADAGVSQAVNWSTGDIAIATVSAQGVVTPVAVGTTTVKATSVADPTVSASTSVSVAQARSVVVTPSSATIGTQQTIPLSATVTVDAGQSTTVSWSTSSSAVATVSTQGVVTGVAPGTAIITATSSSDNTLKGTATITVAPVIRTVVVSPAAPQMFINQTQQLTAAVTADAGLAQTVNWSSSNNAVATVSSSGLVTAVAIGSAVITATSTVDASKKGTAAITVIPRPTSVSIAQRNVVISPGTQATLTAIVLADPGISTTVTWSSSAPNIASIAANSGVVSAVAQGTTLITATLVADPTKKDTVTVSVLPRLASSWTSAKLSGPMIEAIVSIFPVASDLAWAVNDVGDIYKYDGTVWTLAAQGSVFHTVFTAIHGTSATNMVAVGTAGVIAIWDGATWTPMTSGTTQDLIDVWMESPGSAFAVGAGGTARKLTGTTWAATTSTVVSKLNAVWSAGGGVWYAVGSSGVILRFAGSTWTRVTNPPTAETLYDVVGRSVNDVYAVGTFGTILHFDGVTWSVVPSGGVTADLFAVAVPFDGGQRVQVVGDGVALQVNGLALADLHPTYPVRYYTAFPDLTGVLWVGGDRGLVLRNVSGAWSTLNLAPDLLDVWTTAANHSMAVGELGTVYQWNGSTWQRRVAPTTVRLNTVWGLSATSMFAGGDGGLLMRWDGATWTTMTSPTTFDVLALWGTSATNIFATTFGGEILRYNGTSWSTVVPGSDVPLYGIFGSSGTDVYASGDLGTVWRFDGVSWSSRNVGSNALLAGIWASGPSDVYSVGFLNSLGIAYHFTSSWQAMTGLTAPTLSSTWGTSTFDLYTVGEAGTILRYNGSTWQTMPSGTTAFLWSVSGSPTGSGGAFVVGTNSTIVTGSNGSAIVAARAVAYDRRNFLPPSAPTASQVMRRLPDGPTRHSIRAMHTPAIGTAAAMFTRSAPPPLVKYGAPRQP